MVTMDELFLKCPYATSQKILSGKWMLLILHELSEGPIRFGNLLDRMPDMTQTTLTRQLRTLEEYGVVLRTVYAEIPPHVDYRLSEIGEAFMPVLDQLRLWGERYIDVTKEYN